MTIQTILIPKDKFSLIEAKRWIKDQGYKVTYYGKQVHITTEYFRFRQKRPNPKNPYRTKTLKNGIKIVIQ